MANFQSLSPSVDIREIDLTTQIPAVASSIGAFAGEFAWGPVLDATLTTNESDLVTRFGKPNTSTYNSFFTASNFLSYSNALQLVRVDTAAMKNAVTTGTAIKIKNEEQYESSFSAGEASVGIIAAKYPGTLGNSLKVSICDAASYSRNLTGTVAVTSAANTLTGTSTLFTDELAVGDYITITVSGTVYTPKVVTISSDTSVITDTTFTSTVSALTAVAKWEYASLFDAAPVDSNQALAVGATGDGLHMVIVDEDGQFTGATGTVLERFANVSKASNGLNYDGASGYYKNVLNLSKYVWWMDHPESTDINGSGTAFGAQTTPGAYRNLLVPLTKSLVGGLDGYGATAGETKLAFDLFANTEKYDVSLIMTGKATADVARYVIQNIAEARKDSVAFVSPVDTSTGFPIIGDASEQVEEVIAFRSALNLSSSFGVMDSGYKYQYDKYNDVYRWIPLNGDIAGLCARTDYVAYPWYSPAGLERGQIKNVARLAFNPNKAQRDALFKVGINPVVTFPSQGTVLFGDKTLLSRPSAFDAINVRRLFIAIEKAIAIASRSFLFELNTPLTRQLFSAMIIPYLRDVQGRGGITDFFVDVSAMVNTPEVIDSNELRANILIKPSRSIRNIQLNFVAVRTGVSFSEIEI